MKTLLFVTFLMAMPATSGQDVTLSISRASAIGVHVTGRPYSAESVLEKTQTLPDGNRIVQRTTARQFRDGEGRERSELVNDIVGPIVIIADPVAKLTWLMNPKDRTAHRTPRPADALPMVQVPSVPAHSSSIGVSIPIRQPGQAPIPGIEHGAYVGGIVKGGATEKAGMLQGDVVLSVNGQPVADGRDLVMRIASVPVGNPVTLTVKRQDKELSFTMTTKDRDAVGPPTDIDIMMLQALLASKLTPAQVEKVKKESLGTQTMDGVEVRGERFAVPVAAGEVGNERPFEVVNERWYSPELNVTVMERHFDPRSGETVYRLTGIVRGEPDPALFQVPKDFKILQGTTPALLMKKEE